MAQTKCWRLRLTGRLSADQIGASLPEGAASILRVDHDGDETQVYYSTVEQAAAPGAMGYARAGEPEEVSLEAVTRIE